MSNFASVPYNLKHDVEYRRKTGRLLAHRIGQQFAKLGHKTWICKGQSNGLDLKVFDSENNLIIVAEMLNWGPRTNLNDKRKLEIITNLSGYNCNKLLIYTQMGNEHVLDDLKTVNISTVKIGCQIVAKYFYHKLSATQIEGRKIDSRETTLLIKSKLGEYLQSLHIARVNS